MNFLQARTNMVIQQVRPWYVFDENVLSILNQIPRELFVPKIYEDLAYTDTDIPLIADQTMLSPKIVGRALQALKLSPSDKVLEIGTGTGYVTACLSKLAGRMTSVEIHADLLAQAKKNLSGLHCRQLTLEQGNAALGWESMAPYDAIFVTGSYPLGVPQTLCDQLSNKNGRLFAICGEAPSMQAVLIKRQGQAYQTEILFDTCVPALEHAPKPKLFHF